MSVKHTYHNNHLSKCIASPAQLGLSWAFVLLWPDKQVKGLSPRKIFIQNLSKGQTLLLTPSWKDTIHHEMYFLFCHRATLSSHRKYIVPNLRSLSSFQASKISLFETLVRHRRKGWISMSGLITSSFWIFIVTQGCSFLVIMRRLDKHCMKTMESSCTEDVLGMP